MSCMILILFFGASLVQSQNIKVDLFVPLSEINEGDRVEMRGTFSKEYSWDRGLRLTQVESERWSAEISVDEGIQNFEYKYVIQKNNGEIIWEVGENRIYHAEEHLYHAFREIGGEKVSNDVTVSVMLDLSGKRINSHPIDKVAILGERYPLGWELPEEIHVLNRRGEERGHQWELDIDFPSGTYTDIPVKFAFEADGVWYWEDLPGHIDHLFMLDSSTDKAAVEFKYNTESRQIRKQSETGMKVDHYREAAQRYGNTRRYRYMLAMDLLESGNAAEARTVYEEYRMDYNTILLDDFDFNWAWYLYENAGLLEAIAFIHEKKQEEFHDWRRAYLQYLEGELLLEDDQFIEARTTFERALIMAPEADSDRLIQGYASLGLARTYMVEENDVEKLNAANTLRELAASHPDEQMKRQGLQHLAHLGRLTEHNDLLTEALQSLTATGSKSQRLQSQLEFIEHRIWKDHPDSLLHEMEVLSEGDMNPHQSAQLELHRAEVLDRKGDSEHARRILADLATRREFPAVSDRADSRLQQLMKRGN